MLLNLCHDIQRDACRTLETSNPESKEYWIAFFREQEVKQFQNLLLHIDVFEEDKAEEIVESIQERIYDLIENPESAGRHEEHLLKKLKTCQQT